MRVHLDVLGWLYVLMGGMGLLSGAALGLLAVATAIALPGSAFTDGASNPVVWLLLLSALLLAGGGAIMIVVGKALIARRRHGRPAALLTAVVNLFLLPFGTALGIYTFWALLNDDARREFGRRPRAPLATA